MLTLTPCVCVLAAIAFSTLFERYLKEDDIGGTAGSNNETNVSNGNGKYYSYLKFCSEKKLHSHSSSGEAYLVNITILLYLQDLILSSEQVMCGPAEARIQKDLVI